MGHAPRGQEPERRGRWPPSLPPEPEPADDRLVALRAGPVEVSEEPSPLADHHEQAAATVVVVACLAKMLGQMLDAFGEERDLYLRRPRVGVVAAVRADDLTLIRRRSERHPLSFPGSYGSLFRHHRTVSGNGPHAVALLYSLSAIVDDAAKKTSPATKEAKMAKPLTFAQMVKNAEQAVPGIAPKDASKKLKEGLPTEAPRLPAS